MSPPAVMTPGTYLAKRRVAGGLSIEDVVASIATDPRLGSVDRKAWIEAIETDTVPVTVDVVRTLQQLFSFSPVVLGWLRAFRDGGATLADMPRICAICGCCEHDACREEDRQLDAVVGCAWSGPETCTRCAPAKDAA